MIENPCVFRASVVCAGYRYRYVQGGSSFEVALNGSTPHCLPGAVVCMNNGNTYAIIGTNTSASFTLEGGDSSRLVTRSIVNNIAKKTYILLFYLFSHLFLFGHPLIFDICWHCIKNIPQFAKIRWIMLPYH